MPKQVEFFYDFTSPTAYLAWRRLPGVLERTVAAMPTSSSMRTAARLLDVRSAARIVIASPARCSSSGTHAPCSVITGWLRPVISVAGVWPRSSAAA